MRLKKFQKRDLGILKKYRKLNNIMLENKIIYIYYLKLI